MTHPPLKKNTNSKINDFDCSNYFCIATVMPSTPSKVTASITYIGGQVLHMSVQKKLWRFLNDHKRSRNNWKTLSFVDLRSGSRAGIEGPGITETLYHLSIFGPGSRAGIEGPVEKWATLLCVDLRSWVQGWH